MKRAQVQVFKRLAERPSFACFEHHYVDLDKPYPALEILPCDVAGDGNERITSAPLKDTCSSNPNAFTKYQAMITMKIPQVRINYGSQPINARWAPTHPYHAPGTSACSPPMQHWRCRQG